MLKASARLAAVTAPRMSASMVVTAPIAGPTEPTAYNYRVLMVRRIEGLSFDRALVFPGGIEEGEDHQNAALWKMDAPKLCAIRETYEETGLLLTTPCRPDRQREIQSQVDSMLSLSALCSRRGIRPLDPRPIGRWITPRAKQRRFDTWFYMLNIGDTDNFLLDQLESGRVQQEELEGMHWLCPGEVLRENARSKTALFPPQFYILSELARYKRWQDLAGYSPSTSPIEPLLCPRSDGKVVALLPGDRAYPTTAMAADCGPPTASGLAISDADLFGEDRVEESGMHRIVMEPTNKPGGFYAASLHQGHLIAAGRTARL